MNYGRPEQPTQICVYVYIYISMYSVEGTGLKYSGSTNSAKVQKKLNRKFGENAEKEYFR